MFWSKNNLVVKQPKASPAFSIDDIRGAIRVAHSPASTEKARVTAHNSLICFQDSEAAWAGGLQLVRALPNQPEFMVQGLFGASMLATKAQRGDYVEDRAMLMVAILEAIGFVSHFPASLRWQYEITSLQNELAIAAATVAAPSLAALLLESSAFHMLEPLEALLTLGRAAFTLDSTTSGAYDGNVGVGLLKSSVSCKESPTQSKEVRIQCETRVVALLRPALKIALDAGIASVRLVSAILNSVSVYAAEDHSTISLNSLSANGALKATCLLATGNGSNLGSMQRTAAMQLLKTALANEFCIDVPLDEFISETLVVMATIVLNQVERDLAPITRARCQNSPDKASVLALGTGALELTMALTETISAQANDKKDEGAPASILLARLASLCCHSHLPLSKIVAPAWPALLRFPNQVCGRCLTLAHARKLLDAVLERVREGFHALNFPQGTCTKTMNDHKHPEYSEGHSAALEFWVNSCAARVICVCSQKIGVVQSLASAAKFLEDVDLVRSEVATVVCAALASDTLATAHAGDEMASVVLLRVVNSLQFKIMHAASPDSRRRAAVAFSKYAKFCALRGGDVLSAAISTLLDAAAADSIDSMAAPRRKAACAALDALRCVSLAAFEILSILPNLKDRRNAAEAIHTNIFLHLQSKVQAGT